MQRTNHDTGEPFHSVAAPKSEEIIGRLFTRKESSALLDQERYSTLRKEVTSVGLQNSGLSMFWKM
jgi:hypothetical protein